MRTQACSFGAFSGRRYGSFAGREGAHPVDQLTQARAFAAHAGGRYGLFTGRGEGGHPVSRLTQALALGAHASRRYGSFAGRTGDAGPGPQPPPFVFGLPVDLREQLLAGLIDEDDLLMVIAGHAIAAGLIH